MEKIPNKELSDYFNGWKYDQLYWSSIFYTFDIFPMLFYKPRTTMQEFFVIVLGLERIQHYMESI